MKIEFYVEDEFLAQSKRLSKKYHSLKSDLKPFRKSLEEDPFQGSNLGKGVKKSKNGDCQQRQGQKRWSTYYYL